MFMAYLLYIYIIYFIIYHSIIIIIINVIMVMCAQPQHPCKSQLSQEMPVSAWGLSPVQVMCKPPKMSPLTHHPGHQEGQAIFWEFHPLKQSREQRLEVCRVMMSMERICEPPLLLIHLPCVTGHF